MAEKRKKRAAALRYDPEKDGAPVLAAFGEGYLADKIVDSAQESGVPITRDASLVSLLASIGVGDEIPEELYEVVARLLLFVSEMDGEYARKVRAAEKNSAN
ncbi:MAG: EscU/YscU/HrcU family type III secretion system export apparatus switch protein [Oscillospiraceae bacterium]|jgi:flagellar biosynthesis protein|nr:EscU/YscU/HrcU family type III secretion system export apparatus switch protein [Oscillospiraceae bacterium]